MERTLWDYDDLATRLNTKKSTLYGWVHQGLIPHVRFSKRYVRFRPEEIEKWLADKDVPKQAANAQDERCSP